MAFTKITNVDTAGRGVVGLPDTPGLSTAAMQAKFDELATDVIIPKHNNLIDELEATTAAASIGAVATTHTSGANVKAVLDALDTYSTTLNTNMVSYVDAKDLAMKTYVDGQISTIDARVDGLTNRMITVENNVVAQNARIFDVENIASQALSLATTANATAQSAEHDALTALQDVATIMTLLQMLLGHVYINTEDEDRLNCENGDRILMDY